MTLARIDDKSNHLVVVNMNASKRGALSPDLYGAILSATAQANDTPRICAVIIASEGGYFCAGGDLNAIQTRRSLDEASRRAKIDELHDVIRAIRSCRVPVIAAVEGGAAGAGFSLAMSCDLFVADAEANLVASYARAGLVPDGGLTFSLAQSLPRALVTQICLLAEPISARRLFDLGAINEVCAANDVMQNATDLAEKIAKGPSASYAKIKKMVGSAFTNSLAEQLDVERDGMAAAVVGEEATEGIGAFLEKRKPDFSKVR